MGGVGDVAASHHAALSRSQAVVSGLSALQIRRELERSTLRAIAPRVYSIHGAPSTWLQSLKAATLTANGAGTASHRAAAQVHSVDGFTDDFLEITVPRGRRVRMDGVTVHQSPIEASHCLEVDGIPCTSLARTIVDLGQVVDDERMIRAIDSFQRMGYSLTWLEQVATELHRPGQRGSAFVLRQVRERQQSGVVRGSWMERLIEIAIASPKLPALALQHIIREDEGGAFIAQVDLAFPALRFGIEAHSRSFHTGTHQELLDQRRENRAIAEGWAVSVSRLGRPQVAGASPRVPRANSGSTVSGPRDPHREMTPNVLTAPGQVNRTASLLNPRFDQPRSDAVFRHRRWC